MEIKSGDSILLTNNALVVPDVLFHQYASINISTIFKWQSECLGIPGVLEGSKNLVYSAPTSAGKTFVAEITVIKRILESKLKAFIILPYVSVSREKMIHLQKLFTGLGIRVGGFMAGQSPSGGLRTIDVAVCTIEKANSLVNRLIEEDRLDELGIVVVDELHLIGDSHRGYLLELLLTKLLLHTRRKITTLKETTNDHSNSYSPSVDLNEQNQIVGTARKIQLIGMSATLPNLELLGRWLDAAVYVTDFRPVPLIEYVISYDQSANTSHTYMIACSGCKSSDEGQSKEFLKPVENLLLDSQLIAEANLNAVDEDGVFSLCLDTLLNGHGVLVFCPTKQWCEQLADTLARQIFILTQSFFAKEERKLVHSNSKTDEQMSEPLTATICNPGQDIGSRLAAHLDRAGLKTCVDRLKRCSSGLDISLARCLGYAVAFHHAGLIVEEREVIESGFRNGLIRILVATSTLSSGVNLPARRVIVRTPFFHGRILDYLTYKQMVGRAGRKGADTSGESILLCKPRDLSRVRQLVAAGMPPISSCLINQNSSPESSLKRALLEVIANGFVETYNDAIHYLSSTLLATAIVMDEHCAMKISTPTSYTTPKRRSLRLSQSKQYSASTSTPTMNDSKNNNNNIKKNKIFSIDFSETLNESKEFINQITNLLYLCISDLKKHDLIFIDELICSNQLCEFCQKRQSDNNDFICNCARLQPTALGRAILSSSLGPVNGLIVFEELDRARQAIALDTELHLVYLLTPVYLDVGTDMDWLSYLEQYQSLSAADRRVADLIGVEERFITRCAAGATANSKHGINSSGLNRRLTIHRRFYTAMVLYRLVCEDGLGVVSKKFGVNRGLLQSLQQQAATYAGMITVFCNRLGWTHMERLIANFQSRMCYGVAEELVDLLRLLPLINAERARALYSSGYCSISSLATAKPQDIARILQRAVPFQRSKSEDETSHTKHLRTIQLDDGRLINENEAAPIIIESARQLLQNDLNLMYGTNLILLTNTEKELVNKSNERYLLSSQAVIDQNVGSLNETEGHISGNNLNEHITNLSINKKIKSEKPSGSTQISSQISCFFQSQPKRIKLSSPSKSELIINSLQIPFTDITVDPTLHNEDNVNSSFNNSSMPVKNVDIIDTTDTTTTTTSTTHATSNVDENLSSQSFILTTQLAAMLDYSIISTNLLKSNDDRNNDHDNKQIINNESPNTNVNIKLSLSKTTCKTNSCMKTLKVNQISNIDLNDTLTYSMFDDSNEIDNSNRSIDAEKKLFPVDSLKTNVSNDLHKSQDEWLIDSQNFQSQYIPVSNLPVNTSYSALNNSVKNTDTILNDSLCSDECNSMGDLFEASTFTSPGEDVQKKNENSCSPDLSFVYISGQKRSESCIKPESSSNIIDQFSSCMQNFDVDTENCMTSSGLFSIIDVTCSSTLWDTFLMDFNKCLDKIYQSHSNSAFIAVQPGWSLNTVGSETFKINSEKSNTQLMWFSGPAGHPTMGGGVGNTQNNLCSLLLSGIAISSSILRSKTVFWINLLPSVESTEHMNTENYLNEIHKLFIKIKQYDIGLIVWDTKWFYRILYELFKFPGDFYLKLYDPSLFSWLKNPDGGRCSFIVEFKKSYPELNDLINQFTSIDFPIEPPTQFSDWTKLPCDLSNQCPPIGQVQFDHFTNLSNCVNITSVQCFLLSFWTDCSLEFDDNNLLNKMELPCLNVLAKLESHGFEINSEELQKCYNSLTNACKLLEQVAYRLSGSQFALDSPKEISEVLFKRLHLPLLTSKDDQLNLKKRNRVALLNGRRPNFRANHLPKATNLLLSRLSSLHPLPNILIEWRHINGVLEKIFTSLFTSCQIRSTHKNEFCRISSTYDVYTATGRIISIGPNIQAVPNDILIDWPRLHIKPDYNKKSNSPEIKHTNWSKPFNQVIDELPKECEIIRPRMAFIAPSGSILISGDFCQLELRLLAHFSKDAKLLQLLSVQKFNSKEIINDSKNIKPPSNEADAFRKLAAHWLNIPDPKLITDQQRQQTKQLCYAIIYGMTSSSLAEQMEITESNAQNLIDSFLHAYPGIQKFISSTISNAHRNGQVQTLNGHIRLLPALNQNNNETEYIQFNQKRSNDLRQQFAIAKAERQAVNTVIQGSAAEIAKIALLTIDQTLQSRNLSSCVHLVLHEHDELIYEIYPESAAPEIGSLIRNLMSEVGHICQISLPLPVKLRAGYNWADLQVVDW